MSAPLNASAKTVGALLSSAIFEIPAYQREYAWEESEVSEFWTDLSAALSRDSYFLGLVILTGADRRKQVVDGQQRLLTLTLLSAALRHHALDAGRRALADRINSTILRSMDYATDEVIPRVVLTDPRANDCLQAIIDNDQIDVEALVSPGSSSERLWKAYEILRRSLRDDDGRDLFKRLGAWAEFLDEQLYVAVFEHPDEGAAYSVFEVINTRGRQLTTADLLKNYVLRNTPEDDRTSLYEQWQRISESFEKLGGQTFVQYIRHVVNLNAGYVLPKDLYNYIAKRGQFRNTNPPSIAELMESLEENLPLYMQLIEPTLEGPAGQEALGVFVALNELNVLAVRPLMLALSRTENAEAGMLSVLQLIVKRIVVGNLGTGSVERKFAECAQAVYGSGEWENSLGSLQDLDHSRDDFVSTMIRRGYNRGVLTFLRRSAIEHSMTPESKGTIHYLRPRSLSNDSWEGLSNDEAAFWASTIGNTLLAEIDRRPRAASTWEGVKRNLLPLAVNNEIVDQLESYEVWNVSAVEEVGRRLAEDAADVWF